MAAELKQIRIERTVGNALTASAFNLLPDELRNDYAVSWLREFSDSEYRQYGHQAEDRREYDFILDMLQKMVADNVKFYSAVLFHIGRRLKVAQLADQKIASALEPQHLQETIEANQTLSIQDDRLAAIGILRETLNEAKRVHSNVTDQNWSLWEIWKKEIGQFQQAMGDASQKMYREERDHYGNPILMHAPARLMRDSFQHKELKKRMDTMGFRVDVGETAVDPQTMVLLQLLTMDRYELRDRFDVIRQDNISRGLDADALRGQREQEMSAHVQKQLANEFGNTDPFKAYAPLEKLPDGNLYALYIKCKLPDNSKFYYAERWLKTLDEPFHYYYEHRVPNFKPELTTGDIQNYARSADSAIKRNWVEENGNTSGLPEQRVQYSLEKKWIEPFIVAIRYGDKKRNQDWTFSAASELIAAVIMRLNELGYQLSSPERKRLEKLWTTAKKEYYSIDW